MEDIDLMENLGIYEVSPQDFALCEFVCTSKMDVQKDVFATSIIYSIIIYSKIF